MYKILRIIFCALAAVLAAAAIFIFVFFGWLWGLCCVFAVIVCAALMITFKKLQEDKEKKANPSPASGDFITGKPDDKNND